MDRMESGGKGVLVGGGGWCGEGGGGVGGRGRRLGESGGEHVCAFVYTV